MSCHISDWKTILRTPIACLFVYLSICRIPYDSYKMGIGTKVEYAITHRTQDVYWSLPWVPEKAKFWHRQIQNGIIWYKIQFHSKMWQHTQNYRISETPILFSDPIIFQCYDNDIILFTFCFLFLSFVSIQNVFEKINTRKILSVNFVCFTLWRLATFIQILLFSKW